MAKGTGLCNAIPVFCLNIQFKCEFVIIRGVMLRCSHYNRSHGLSGVMLNDEKLSLLRLCSAATHSEGALIYKEEPSLT